MNSKFICTRLSLILVFTLLSGCGSSGGGNDKKSSSSVSGILSDGLIKGSTVKLLKDDVEVEKTITDSNGEFHFSKSLENNVNYTLLATGGMDMDTKEDFNGVIFKSPLKMFDSDKKNVVISPITSLVSEKLETGVSLSEAKKFVKDELKLSNESQILVAPHKDLNLQKISMKLAMISKAGHSFANIQKGLIGSDGINDEDIEKIITKNTKYKMLIKNGVESLSNATTKEKMLEVYNEHFYKRKIIENLNDNALMPSKTVTSEKIAENFNALAKKFENEKLNDKEITASLIGVNFVDNAFDINKIEIRKLDKDLQFTDTLKVLYYTVGNPKTNNSQLLAYDVKKDKAFVVNTDVVLGKKVFIYEGNKEENKEVYKSKKYGIYLDPAQENETRVRETKYGPIVYKFYSNNALMKFNPAKPSDTKYIFSSNNIPKELQTKGIKKLGKYYEVLENIVDVDNSYINLKAFDSLADLYKKESEDEKKQIDLIVRLGDSKVIKGKALNIIKDENGKTDSILALKSDIYITKNAKPLFKLVKYDKDLNSKTEIAQGKFYFATKSKTYVYLLKEGDDKIWAFNKSTNSLNEVSGIKLAGKYSYSIHAKAASHGSNTALIDGGSSLSGSNRRLSDGENAYFAFNYDLFANVGKAYIFGSFGAYKNSQVFKLNGLTGKKIFDNGDGIDNSLEKNNTEPIKGHINLVAVKDNKLFLELGWYDATDSCTAKITPKYPPGSKPLRTCLNVDYGTIDTSKDSTLKQINYLKHDGKNVGVKELPYYVARRIAPVSVNDKVYVTLFAGGTKQTGYEYKQYSFDYNSNTALSVKDGRTYFLERAKRENGIYDGEVLAWDKNTQTITNSKNEVIVKTDNINGNKGASIFATSNGVPSAGIGIIAMLANNIGNHRFNLFAVDVDNKDLKYIDLAPFGGWIYE